MDGDNTRGSISALIGWLVGTSLTAFAVWGLAVPDSPFQLLEPQSLSVTGSTLGPAEPPSDAGVLARIRPGATTVPDRSLAAPPTTSTTIDAAPPSSGEPSGPVGEPVTEDLPDTSPELVDDTGPAEPAEPAPSPPSATAPPASTITALALPSDAPPPPPTLPAIPGASIGGQSVPPIDESDIVDDVAGEAADLGGALP